MIRWQTRQYVAGLTARSAYEFLTSFDDRDFQAWWPGVHLRVVAYRRTPQVVGSVYYLDQFIGSYRVKATEMIVAAVPGRSFLRQILLWGMRLPVRMRYDFDEDDHGVAITHTTLVGFSGVGRTLDPAFRLYFTARFADALNRHLLDELRMLGDLIPARARRTAAASAGTSPHSELPAISAASRNELPVGKT